MKIHVNRNGQQLGVFEQPQLAQMAQRGELQTGDMFVREGETNWQPIGNLFPAQPQKPRGSVFGILLPIFGFIICVPGFLVVVAQTISYQKCGGRYGASCEPIMRLIIGGSVVLAIGIFFIVLGIIINSLVKSRNRRKMSQA